MLVHSEIQLLAAIKTKQKELKQQINDFEEKQRKRHSILQNGI